MSARGGRGLDELAARLPRVAPFAATRESPQVLTPARAMFDGKLPPPTVEIAVHTDEEDAAADVDLAPLALEGAKKKNKHPPDGPFIVLASPGVPVVEEVTRAEIVAQCADTVGMLVRHRAERPMHELAENERQLFAQLDAVAISGGDCVRSLVSFWRENTDDPWKALGTILALACLDGIDVLQAIFREIEALPDDAAHVVVPAGEALLLSPHPYVPDLARDLLRSQHALARAAGLEALGRRGAASIDDIGPCLADPHPAVVAAAVRASSTVPPAHGAPLLFPLMAHREPSIAWPAARQLLVWGRPEPYFEVRNGRAEGLGHHALEVLVCAGAAVDLELFEQILARTPPSAEQLSAIARFGAPTAWALLLHHLANDDLADDAARALVTLFGERVPLKELKKPAAWRSAIAGGRFDPDVRYRRGEPWRPRAVAAEMRKGNFPRAEMRVRIDELMVRTGARVDVELARWASVVWPAIQLSADAFEKADGQYAPGTWSTRAR